jgi:hypothetical protein
MPPVKRIMYLLVLVDTFTEWVEAFPMTNKKASTVTMILVMISSHNLVSQPPFSQTTGLNLFLYFPKIGTSLKYSLEISHSLSLPIFR